GTIRGSWQIAHAPRPRIQAYVSEDRESAEASSESDGSFDLLLLDLQPVRLRVSIEGVDRWIGGGTFEAASTFRIRSGQHVAGVSVVEGGILCDLRGPGDLNSHQSQVTLYDESGHAYTDDNTTYMTYGSPIRICNLPTGSYRLYVHGDCGY